MKCSSVTECVRGIFCFLEQSTKEGEFRQHRRWVGHFEKKIRWLQLKMLRKLQVSVKWRWILWKVISSSSSFTSERINEKKWPRRGGFFSEWPWRQGRWSAICLLPRGQIHLSRVSFEKKKRKKKENCSFSKYFFPIMWIYHSSSESSWISKASSLFGSTDGVGSGYFVWHFIWWISIDHSVNIQWTSTDSFSKTSAIWICIVFNLIIENSRSVFKSGTLYHVDIHRPFREYMTSDEHNL